MLYSSDVGDLVPLVDPHVGAVVLAHRLGRELHPLVGEVALEQVGRLDDVVVDAHQDQVVCSHRNPPGFSDAHVSLSPPGPRVLG